MERFVLHTRLASDTVFVADWALCRVLLMNDARFPWLILVPRRADLTELHELAHAERLVLVEEAARASRGLKSVAGADKINLGALGNVVPQLHLHVVARKAGDAAWPGPVWGQGRAEPYTPEMRESLLDVLSAKL